MKNWIDLMGNAPMNQAQLDARNSAHVHSKYSADREDMINRMVTGVGAGLYKFKDNEAALAQEYGAWCTEVEEAREKARADSILLRGALTYEKAKRRLERYILAVGRPEILPVAEALEPDTGEITQEAIPGVPRVEPLPPNVTVPTYNDEGEQTGTRQEPDPLIVQDEAERAEAQAVVDNASQEELNLIALRIGA